MSVVVPSGWLFGCLGLCCLWLVGCYGLAVRLPWLVQLGVGGVYGLAVRVSSVLQFLVPPVGAGAE